jgi:hypothetical protein
MSNYTPPSKDQQNEFFREFLAHIIACEKMGKAFSDKIEKLDFKKPWMRVLWLATKELYKRNKDWPRMPAILIEIEKYYDGVNLQEVDRTLVDEFLADAFREGRDFDPAYFTIEGEQAIENQRCKTIYDKANRGDYTSVEQVIEALQKVKRNIRTGNVTSVDPFERMFLTEIGNVVQTGITELDNRLPGGGHMTGRIMLVVGFTNNGKSTMLRTIEVAAAKLKQKVLVITLEDSVREVAEKAYANLAGIPATLLQHPKHRTPELLDKIRKFQDLVKGYYRIVDPFDPEINEGKGFTNSLCVDDIAQIVEQEKARDPEIKLVSIDYFNRIRSSDKKSTSDDESRDMRKIAEELKDKIAKRFDVAVITCAQSTGDAFNKAVLEINDTARSRESAWAFDVIGTLGSPRELNAGFNEPSNKKFMDAAQAENEAALAAKRVSFEDLLQGKCPLKMVTFNLAKVRGGMKGKFPIYADFCYGRFAEAHSIIETIKGPQQVDEIVSKQILELEKGQQIEFINKHQQNNTTETSEQSFGEITENDEV